jgi:hypothetical protein
MTNDKDSEDALTIAYLLGVKHGRAEQNTQTDALKMAREALEGMARYSGMRESWQDDNPQYVTALYEAIDVIDAALKEQSK